jgi:predicted Mrr-cat superfamily restriction endonuclease
MPRYWVIAPYHADKPEFWKIWNYDLTHDVISIGWKELGDISVLSEAQLSNALDRTYSAENPEARKQWFGSLRRFYHSIKEGDVVIARQGRQKIAGVGTVTRAAYYEQKKNPEVFPADQYYPNHIDVEWYSVPRDKTFDRQVFAMQTVYEIPADKVPGTRSRSSNRQYPDPFSRTAC